MSKSPGTDSGLPHPVPEINLREVAIDLEITSVCDAVCGFCPREFMPDKKRFMSMEIIERLADDLRDTGMFLVVLCGIGESTLHPQLDGIVSTLSKVTKVEMTTHGGARLDTRRFEDLVAHGLTGLHFSLNAASADTHRRVMRLKDFDKTVENLQAILELKQKAYPDVVIHASFVVCDLNHHEVEPWVDFWRQRPGLRQLWLHPINNRAGLLSPDVTAVDLQPLAQKYAGDDLVLVDVFGHLHEEDNLCKIAKQMIFISAEGDMRLCAMDYRRATSYGNLVTHRLRDMHLDKVARYLRGEMNEFCNVCDFCPPGIKGVAVPAGAATDA